MHVCLTFGKEFALCGSGMTLFVGGGLGWFLVAVCLFRFTSFRVVLYLLVKYMVGSVRMLGIEALVHQ